MKLFNVLSVTAFGVLFAVGCSSTDSTGSTDGGTDTGSTPADTGTTPTDTGMAEETATDAGDTCTPCITSKCSAEGMACQASDACKAVLKCIADDIKAGGDGNSCISDETKPGVKEANAYIGCVGDQCAMECK
jgi:hypothetical protein